MHVKSVISKVKDKNDKSFNPNYNKAMADIAEYEAVEIQSAIDRNTRMGLNYAFFGSKELQMMEQASRMCKEAKRHDHPE